MKMPTTRSHRQPTLQFPKRKSSRVSSKPKGLAQPEVEHVLDAQVIPLSPRKANLGVRSGPLSSIKATVEARITPLSPNTKNVADIQAIPLSPRHHMLQSITSQRLPLSPRKRTGMMEKSAPFVLLFDIFNQ